MKKKFIAVLTILMVISLASVGWAVVNNKPTAVITTNPSSNFTLSDPISIDHFNSSDPDGHAITAVQWDIKMKVQDEQGEWSDWTQKTVTVGQVIYTQTVYASDDAYYLDHEWDGTFYIPDSASIDLSRGQEYFTSSFIKFNLSNIPSNAQMIDAKIELSNNNLIQAGPPYISRITSNWNESSGVPQTTPNSVTGWPMGNYGNSSFPYLDKDLVQGWVNGSILNQGISIYIPSDNNETYLSREGGGTTNGPRLVLRYKLPQ